MNVSYIKLFREVQEHWLFRESRKFSRFEAWIDLLLLAAFVDHKVTLQGQLYELRRGDVLYSQRELARRWGWSEKKLRNFFQLLEKEGMILLHTLPHRVTQITICNYARWQDWGSTEESTHYRTEDALRKHQYRRNNNGNKGKEVLGSLNNEIAVQVYESYAANVRAGARADAIRNIEKLLRQGYTQEVLEACVERYTRNGMPTEVQYRIQANNFFGKAERFKDYLPDESNPRESRQSEQSGLTVAERVFGGIT